MIRCPQCRTKRSTFQLMVNHIAASGHKLCNCGGYHYKHRPNSALCELNPLSPLYSAMQDSSNTLEQLQEIELECILSSTGKPLTEWTY